MKMPRKTCTKVQMLHFFEIEFQTGVLSIQISITYRYLARSSQSAFGFPLLYD